MNELEREKLLVRTFRTVCLCKYKQGDTNQHGKYGTITLNYKNTG
jgi:hypothetical protein